MDSEFCCLEQAYKKELDNIIPLMVDIAEQRSEQAVGISGGQSFLSIAVISTFVLLGLLALPF